MRQEGVLSLPGRLPGLFLSWIIFRPPLAPKRDLPPHATRKQCSGPSQHLCPARRGEEGPSCVQKTPWTTSLQGVPENWAGQAEHQLVTCKLFMCTSRFSWREPGALQH